MFVCFSDKLNWSKPVVIQGRCSWTHTNLLQRSRRKNKLSGELFFKDVLKYESNKVQKKTRNKLFPLLWWLALCRDLSATCSFPVASLILICRVLLLVLPLIFFFCSFLPWLVSASVIFSVISICQAPSFCQHLFSNRKSQIVSFYFRCLSWTHGVRQSLNVDKQGMTPGWGLFVFMIQAFH